MVLYYYILLLINHQAGAGFCLLAHPPLSIPKWWLTLWNIETPGLPVFWSLSPFVWWWISGISYGGLPISLGTLWLILAEDSMGFLNGSVGVVQMTWGFNGLGTGGCVDFMKKIRCVHRFEPDLAMEILCHATRFTRDSMDWTEISMGYWQRIMMGLSPFLRKQSQMLHGAGIFTYIETPKMAQWCR